MDFYHKKDRAELSTTGAGISARYGSGWMIISGQVIALSIFIGLIIFIVYRMDQIRIDVHNITEQNNRKSELVYFMYTSARERVLNLYRMLDMDDPFERDELFLEYSVKGGAFASARDELMSMKLQPEELALLEDQGELAGIVTPQLDEITNKIQNDEVDDARHILNTQSIHNQTKLLSKLEELLLIQQRKSKEITESIDSQFYYNRFYTVLWSLLALLLGFFITTFMFLRVIAYEREISREARKSSATLQSITDGIVTVSHEGNVKYVNRKAEELLDTQNEKDSKIWDLIDFTNEHDQEKFRQLLMSQSSQLLDMGMYAIWALGAKRWLNIYSSQAYDQDMTLISTVLVLSDVTEIKESEIALQKYNENLEEKVYARTRDLERANVDLKDTIQVLEDTQQQLIQSEKMAALGSLVAGISHEVNTPIGVSLTSATSMLESFERLKKHYTEGSLSENKFQDYTRHNEKGIEILIQNLNRASDLIRSFKQVAVDQSSGEWRRIDLKNYTDEIITSLHPKIKRTKITVNNHINHGLDVLTNPGSYYQILSNLIVNSVIHAFPEEYFQKNKNRTPKIDIQASLDGDKLNITYSDNGRGMDDDTLKKIFDPFFTTRRGVGGSGLGMNIIYNIVVSQFNGEIEAISAPDEGLKLIMKLPLAQGKELDNE